MPSGLRDRFVLACAAVLAAGLLVTGGVLLFLLQGYQDEVTLARLGDAAIPVYYQVRQDAQQGVSADQITNYLREQAQTLDVRILLVSGRGVVVRDTEESGLQGRQLSLSAAGLSKDLRRPYRGHYRVSAAETLLFVAIPTAGITAKDKTAGEVAALVLAKPAPDFGPVLSDLLPRLLLAGLVALAVAFFISALLARSICQPVLRVASAAEKISRGQYDQQVAATGPDETRRLAESFNIMASEVSRSRRVLRDFVANVSHELKTPLASIRGFVQAMRDGTIGNPKDMSTLWP